MYIKQVTTMLICCLLLTVQATAQEEQQDEAPVEKGEKERKDKDTSGKAKYYISLSPGDGLSMGYESKVQDSIEKEKKKDKAFDVKVGVVDIGINSLQDKTNYSNLGAAGEAFLAVPEEIQNENLFNLRSGKSWNVNVWPVLTSWRLVNGRNQRIYIGSGVGLQMYNFRFSRPVTYINETTPMVFLDTVHGISKNKLGFTYLSIPLMFTFKTRAGEKAWFVYGVGITGGYRIASWTKQVSNEKGKQKNHDKFNFSDFNSCLTAEIGLESYFRLYASYQITPLHDDGLLEQYPFSIGLRFGGI